ncbi:protein of unknown function [Candidatus Nitrospira inopinata]|uniref:Uncharacterized protein n=1 Tax=Candidatus Nitrospira inopinata TaxID=1715989 RepID=A0A0S4KVW9_9BACT|nr:protein of unknown function [Candidatus Nitrospira inopinata]
MQIPRGPAAVNGDETCGCHWRKVCYLPLLKEEAAMTETAPGRCGD